jgi:hypothetical protein
VKLHVVDRVNFRARVVMMLTLVELTLLLITLVKTVMYSENVNFVTLVEIICLRTECKMTSILSTNSS